ncbi:hypothetical protein [Arthrobacter pigmenti]
MSTAVDDGLVVRVGGQPRTEVVQSLRNMGVQLNGYAETLLVPW